MLQKYTFFASLKTASGFFFVFFSTFQQSTLKGKLYYYIYTKLLLLSYFLKIKNTANIMKMKPMTWL